MPREDLLEDEWYHVRHSGEIPEIALHSSIHYLTEDGDGPGIELTPADLSRLHHAASRRYREIIFRDITPANRDETSYRGVLRTISNWRRYKRFCQRQALSIDTVKSELAVWLLSFLQREIDDVKGGVRSSSINCTFEDIASLAVELDISLGPMEESLRPLCLDF
ncbi:MAG TPA: hypothetical protein VJ969_09190 [Desulfopila sp.]|nr:hypothetical protein [Desulfopila sp.]